MKTLASLVLCIALSLPALSAPVVLVDTLPGTLSVGATITDSLFPGSVFGAASPFTTGLAPLSLTSVEAAIGFIAYSGDATGSNLLLGLFSDLGGNPGSLLVSLLPSQPIAPFSTATGSSFLPSSPTLLAANTTFWVVALPTGGNSWYAWNYSSDPSGRITLDGGTTWFTNTASAMRVTADDQLAATGVPELQLAGAAWPGLFCLSLLAVLASRPKRTA